MKFRFAHRTVVALLIALVFSNLAFTPAEQYSEPASLPAKVFADNGVTDMWTGFKNHFSEGFKQESLATKSSLIERIAADPPSALPVMGNFGDEITAFANQNDLKGILNTAGKMWGIEGEVSKPPLAPNDDPMKLVNSIYELAELAGNDAIVGTNRALFKNDRFVTYNKLSTSIHRLVENVYVNHDSSEKLAKSLSKTKAQIWIDITTTLRSAPDVDKRLLFEAAMTLLSLADPAVLDNIDKVLNGYEWPKCEDYDGVEGSVFFCKKYSAGRVIIGGRGKTTYTKPAALIIDLGGNDTYEFAASSQDNVPCSIVIDLDGNDKYVSTKFEGRTVGGLLGVSLLIDRKGMDTYECPTIGLGAGIYGVSLLIDEEGKDKYTGGEFSCGAGMFGLGLLWDKDGDDSYTTGMFSCGFGGPAGVGILLDTKGNDSYKSIGKSSAPDKTKLNQTYSQGCGLGFHPLRPDGGEGTINAAGGIGMLIDSMGDDNYDGGYCCQGASFYKGLGVLYEAAGNDKYKSGSISQGAAIYNGIGLLIELGGNDCYTSSGYHSQGSAYDAAFGFLYEADGRDSYVGEEYCQACTSHNGFALLLDANGSDSYKAKSFSHGDIGTQGEHWEEDWPLIAMLADLGTERNIFSGSGRTEGTNVVNKCLFFLTLKKPLSDVLKGSLKVE